jgi:two-component system phosphate regulon sensor histidine kinase PhoR
LKNVTPTALSITIAGAMALLSTLLALFMNQVSLDSWLELLLFFLLVFLLAYLVAFVAIGRFIYRKIKLVYKSIHQLKVDRFTRDVLGKKLGNDPIAEVEHEVADWAEKNSLEIESLKKAEQYRKEFLTNLSHEIKTPLFSIQGYINTLLDGAMRDEEVLQRFLETTAASTDRLVSLINDLEVITRLETGEVPIEKSTFDIYELTKTAFSEIYRKAESHHITLSVKKGCEKPFYVYADKEKINQVISNLLDNSIKYGKENGNTIVSFYDMGENILIEVTDDGLGIPEENLNRLFERFFRVDKSRSREQGGTGLGLAIVKHIIEAHGQTVNVRSKPGIGSTFGFTLSKAASN